jgi:ATP-dependent helicase/nuclease subunit A
LAGARDEYRRLVYVAMTRAIERLVVCGVDNGRKLPEGCWYGLVREALEGQSVREPADDGGGEVLRFRKVKDEAAAHAIEPDRPAAVVAAPSWLRKPVAAAPPRVVPIKPSGFGKADSGLQTGSPARRHALARGILVHRLLQSLPDIPAQFRAGAMQDYLARNGAELPAEDRARIAEQVMLVTEDRHFYELYGPASRAEVSIAGRVQIGGQTVPVSGQVDRAAVTQASVLIGDFKTDRHPPARIADAPTSYVKQLALYRAVLQKLYPDRPVRAALIWTEVPDLMEISADVLDAALMQVTPA